mmetsp:Transcript_20114/g.67024  ORF Transcript_20114/g.67024 Transcript_20114/m.67024 type:complete len:87 (-) Transcript_20114:5279-5539(-)
MVSDPMEAVCSSDVRVAGVLPNGLRYCIFPNKKPAGRFYVNLEVHAGSVDEEEEQQGIAHFVEHGLFLGTERLCLVFSSLLSSYLL